METSLSVRPTVTESITSHPPLVSKDKKYLICCCGCDVKVYSIKSGKCVHILRGHQDLVTGVAFHPANQFQILSSSLDGTIKKWNFEDGVLITSSTPICSDGSAPLAIYGMYEIPNDRKNFIYVVKTQKDSSEKKAEYRFMKQSVLMERWATSDFISTKVMKDLPTHVSIGGQGSFLAAITTGYDFEIFSLSRVGKSFKHRVAKDASQVEVMQCLAKPTCIAAHPTEDCVAVGHADGKINIWTNVVSKKAVHSWVHWHALPVLSVKYTPEGSYLLSGGHESVLVKWCHGAYGNNGQREFLPRLGAPVSNITSSEDNSVYATSHLDNSIKIVRNWIVVQVFQGLTRDYLSRGKNGFPAGVNFEPRTGALVLNGLPGHLQFYSLSQDMLLYNLDIVGQNYTSGDNLQQQHNYTRIELVQFSEDGSWMVTVERWTGSYSEQCRMKFWFYNKENNSYTLNTDVDRPHQGPVSSVQFSVCTEEDDTQSIMLVSVGATDKRFKLWRLSDGFSDTNKSGSCWRVESTGYYKNKLCSLAEFSEDGSVLAVVFENTLTLWDPFENHLCNSLDLQSRINTAKFCSGAQANLVVIATAKDVILWDLLTFSEKLKLSAPDCKTIAIDSLTDTITAFSDNKGYLFNSSGEFREFDLPGYARNITSAAFTADTPTGPVGTQLSIKRRLYLSTNAGSVLVVDDKDVTDCPDVTPTVEQASKTHLVTNYQQLTPLAHLLNSQLVKQDSGSMKQIDSRRGLAAALIVKQIGETSCVAMPAINTLCRAFLHSLLLDAAPDQTRADNSELSDSEMEVDPSDSEEDDEKVRSKKSSTTEDLVIDKNATTKKSLRKSDILDFTGAWQNAKHKITQ